MQTNDLDQALLRRLAALRADRGKVLSIYLDLDPASFGTQPARSSQISSLIDEADRRARESDLPHAERIALREDVARVREFLRGDFSAKGAHALALFACGPAGLFEALRLPTSTASAVVINDKAWLDPLIGHDRCRRALALINRRTFRLFADGPTGQLEEVVATSDDVHGQHDQGGWSQPRYQRSVEEDVRDHIKRSMQALAAFHREHPIDLLAVAVVPERWSEVERGLAPELRDRCLGRFDVDVEHAGPDEALAAARPLFDAAEERRVAQLLERLHERLARNGDRAAAGLEPVLTALDEQRVESLLYESGFHAPGVACLNCGWIGPEASSGDVCPACGHRPERHENVLEDAISSALLQSARVVTLRDRPELGPLGGIAALLRF
ncbi:MAG: hypothetical protein JWQ48_2729 [Conexibacter sp.]|nr:hypothetical protein [Conexibacter sp.]